jgi:hypothetical protein
MYTQGGQTTTKFENGTYEIQYPKIIKIPRSVIQGRYLVHSAGNLVVDLRNGIKTNAQLILPAVGKGPFPII